MRISKKQLLGFGGLAFVVGLTTIAYNLPTNATSSASVGGAVKVEVEVYSINFETVINSPLDGEIFTNGNVAFSETHSNVDNVKYYLTYIAEDDTKTVYELTDHEFTPTGSDDRNGKTEFSLDLDNYGGHGRYIFRSVATTDGQQKEDSAEFIYAAIEADQKDVSANSDKVSFRVQYSAGVKSLAYQIFDKDGKAVSPEYVHVTSASETGGYADLSIALTGDGLKLASGEYTIIINGYSTVEPSDDSYIGIARVVFSYEADDDIIVPDTGSILGVLNISRADFLITGLVGFSLISLLALFVIRKSHKS